MSALLCADDTYLYLFNDGSENTQDIVFKYQRLPNAWHEALKFTGGNLKVIKR